MGCFTRLVILTRRILVYIGSIVWLFLNTLEEIGDSIRRGRLPFRASMLFAQTDRTGVGSIPLVLMVSFFLGLTMALLTGYQLQKFGTERLVPTLISIAFTRELGPLLTGIVLAARIGAAYTAELGTMQVSEEVEAIEAMGIGPLRFLVAPRLVAISCLMPCLSVHFVHCGARWVVFDFLGDPESGTGSIYRRSRDEPDRQRYCHRVI